MYSRTPVPKAWFEFESGRDMFETSLITVEVINPAEAIEESFRKETQEFVQPLLQQLISWIRVLTRQYWVGYSGRNFRPIKYVMYVGQGEKEKPSHAGEVGWSFEYGRGLDAATWAQIETKLALGERPKPSQLFFCDALLDIAEGDVAQAIVALGVSCEMEMSILRQDILAGKDEEFQRLFEEYMKPRFEDSFKLLKEFGCDPFREFDEKADRLVRNLYKARGKAAHRGESYYEENGKKVFITRDGILVYVHAVERLFAWSDAQRMRVCDRGKRVATG